MRKVFFELFAAVGFAAGGEAGDQDELMTGRQRVCLLAKNAMVDLLAWRRCMFVSLRQFLERNWYDDSARALLNLAAFIHAAGNTLV